MAYRARHPQNRYVVRIMHKIRREQWEQDQHLLPWVEALKSAEERIQKLQSDLLLLESQNSLLSRDLFRRDEDLAHLRWKLGEAQAEIVRLNVLLDGQSKRKH